MGTKILIPFDGSENAVRAVEYVKTHMLKDSEILFLSITPDPLKVMSIDSADPLFNEARSSLLQIENRRKKDLEEKIQDMRKSLLGAGFREDNIQSHVHSVKVGIARDIAKEAEKGYDLIIIGRKGVSEAVELLLGSVSQKLIHMCKKTPVLLVS